MFRRLFSVLIFIIVLSSCQSDDYRQQLSWNDNHLFYSTDKEVVVPGETLFLTFSAQLQQGYHFSIVSTDSMPLSSKMFNHYYLDEKKEVWIGELIWLETGEMTIDGLSVVFTGPGKVSQQFNIQPLMVDVESKVELSFEKEQASEIWNNVLIKMATLTPFIQEKWMIYVVIVFILLFFILLAVLLTLFFIKRRSRCTKEINQFTEEAHASLRDWRKNPLDQSLLSALYNVLIESRRILSLNRMKLNQDYYSVLVEYIELRSFSSQTDNAEIDNQSIAQSRFVNSFEMWINQIEAIKRKNQDA